MRVVQIEPGPCPTLMAFAPQSARYSTPAALVTLPAMIGSFGNASRSTFYSIAHALTVAVCSGNGHDIHAAFYKSANVGQNAFAGPVHQTHCVWRKPPRRT